MVDLVNVPGGFPLCPKCMSYEGRVQDGMKVKGFDIVSIITLLLPILLQTLQGCGNKTPTEQAVSLVANRSTVAARIRAIQVIRAQNLGLDGKAVAALADTVLANMDNVEDMKTLIVELNQVSSFEMI